MSDENVELVRRAYEAWNEGGPESLKRFLAEDGEWHDPPNLPDSRVVRGRDAVAADLTGQQRVAGLMKVTIVDVRARGETVVLRLELTLHGPESGIDVPAEPLTAIRGRGWQDSACLDVLYVGRGPRSRRAVGVGDVAGERRHFQRRRREMILATAKIEDFDRFWNAFSTKGAEKRKQHGSKGSHVFRYSERPVPRRDGL